MSKILEEGQPCRHCGTPVVRKTHKLTFRPRQKQPYYFEWWFRCPKCKAMYMVEDAKRWTEYGYSSHVDKDFQSRLEREE